MHRSLLLLAIIFVTTSCTNKTTELLYKIEKRDLVNDTIYEYRIFDDGNIDKTCLHNGSAPELVYKVTGSKSNSNLIQSVYQEISEEKNSSKFFFKESITELGTLYKVYFLKAKTIDGKEIQLEKVKYFYSKKDLNVVAIIEGLISGL